MKQEIQILDQRFVEERLDMAACISLMEDTLKKEEEGECTQYLRTAINLPNHNILGMMPAYFDEGYFGAKILSVYPINSREGYPSHQGQIVLFEKEHGQVKAIVDAMSVTKIRTGAVSAAVSRVLANPGSRRLALLGSGEQARSHLKAMLCCFALESVTVWDLFPERAESFAGDCSAKYGIPVSPCLTVQEAVADADIICTLTPAKEPILEYGWLKKGVHINAVGACAPASRELATDVVANARFFGDNVESVLNESGDFRIPLQEGAITREHFLGTVGQVMNGKLAGRTAADEITVFEALGMAVEDIACAAYLCREAEEK